jgi:hypothetical protein
MNVVPSGTDHSLLGSLSSILRKLLQSILIFLQIFKTRNDALVRSLCELATSFPLDKYLNG